MSETDIKLELQRLIEQEKDVHILEAIRTLLKKSGLDPVLKDKLSSRALKAEKDIKEGKLMSRREVEKELHDRLGI